MALSCPDDGSVVGWFMEGMKGLVGACLEVMREEWSRPCLLRAVVVVMGI